MVSVQHSAVICRCLVIGQSRKREGAKTRKRRTSRGDSEKSTWYFPSLRCFALSCFRDRLLDSERPSKNKLWCRCWTRRDTTRRPASKRTRRPLVAAAAIIGAAHVRPHADPLDGPTLPLPIGIQSDRDDRQLGGRHAGATLGPCGRDHTNESDNADEKRSHFDGSSCRSRGSGTATN
jgi:hypothetical protein